MEKSPNVNGGTGASVGLGPADGVEFDSALALDAVPFAKRKLKRSLIIEGTMVVDERGFDVVSREQSHGSLGLMNNTRGLGCANVGTEYGYIGLRQKPERFIKMGPRFP